MINIYHLFWADTNKNFYSHLISPPNQCCTYFVYMKTDIGA